MIVPSTFRLAARVGAPSVASRFAAPFSTSAVASLATPATERPAKMKKFKIYRWVCPPLRVQC